MTTFNEPKCLSDFLLVEACKGWSTQTVLLEPTDVDLPMATILGYAHDIEILPMHYTAVFLNKSSPAVLLAQDVKASSEVQNVVVVARGAVVNKQMISILHVESVQEVAEGSESFNRWINALEIDRGIVAKDIF